MLHTVLNKYGPVTTCAGIIYQRQGAVGKSDSERGLLRLYIVESACGYDCQQRQEQELFHVNFLDKEK